MDIQSDSGIIPADSGSDARQMSIGGLYGDDIFCQDTQEERTEKA